MLDVGDDVLREVARNPNTDPLILELPAVKYFVPNHISIEEESRNGQELWLDSIDDDDDEEGDHKEVEETLAFPGRNSLIEQRVSHFFGKGVALYSQDKHQEGADILFELAYDGHLDSINELAYIFLDQADFSVVEELLECYPDVNNPTILYLRAKMVEAVEALDNLSTETLKAYEKAAIAGSSNAALALVEYYVSKDRSVARKWFRRAKKIGHPKLQYFHEMLNAREKQFTIVIGRGKSGSLTQVAVFRYGTEELLQDFDTISEAIKSCIAAEGGFDFQEDYDDSEEFEASYHIKVFPDSNSINIAEEDHDYWFGNLSDMDAAVEELIRRDCNWDLVFYGLNEQKGEFKGSTFLSAANVAKVSQLNKSIRISQM
jgi:TPR repeat protein